MADTQFPDAGAVTRLTRAFIDVLDYELSEPMVTAMNEIIGAERFAQSPPDFAKLNFKELLDLRKTLKAWQKKSVDGDEVVQDFLVPVFVDLAADLPRAHDPSPFTIPLIYSLPNPGLWISGIYKELMDDKFLEREIFTELREQMYRNICYASDIEPDTKSAKKPKHAFQSKLPLNQLNDTYLRRTPFHKLLASPVPLRFTHEDRFQHMHVLGGSGAGKTNLIENLIWSDLASDDPPTIVLIDPHSDLVRRLVRSDLGVRDRIILIDPRDTAYPIALNPFAINRDRLQTYDETTREQVTAGVIQTFGYLWSGLTSLTLTGKQDVFFRYVTRLMLTLPEGGVIEDGQVVYRNATILDMLNLMRDPAPYGPAIAALPEIPREFFKTDFMSKTFEGTKEQIRYRIQAIIENPTMARLFTSPETKVDFFTEMNRGSVILIDTAQDFLKEGSAIFGKLIISLILQAVLERAAIPENKRKATFIMIDEAGTYFSSNIDDLLREARKYKAGLLLGHQFLDQATSSLRASLAANTGIKFASGLSASDASTMARDMRSNPEFILNQPKYHFAAHIRDVTPSAVSIPIPYYGNRPQLSEQEYAAFIERNRRRVSLGRNGSAPKSRHSSPAVEPASEGYGDEV